MPRGEGPIDPEYRDRYAELQRTHWWFEGRRRVVDAILDRSLPPERPGPLLSVGCGPRENLGWLERRGPVVGVDVEGILGRRGSAPFVQASVERLPFRDASFDAVLALDVLEHVDDDPKAALELTRVLRPGGLLVVTVPALPWLWGPHDDVNHHRRRYTPATLRAAFAGTGLRSRITFFNTLLFAPIAAVRVVRSAVTSLRGIPERASADFEAPGAMGPLDPLFRTIFAFERHLVGRLPLPIGVSLLAVGRRPNQ